MARNAKPSVAIAVKGLRVRWPLMGPERTRWDWAVASSGPGVDGLRGVLKALQGLLLGTRKSPLGPLEGHCRVIRLLVVSKSAGVWGGPATGTLNLVESVAE